MSWIIILLFFVFFCFTSSLVAPHSGRESKSETKQEVVGRERERLPANPSKEGRAENGAATKSFVFAPFSARPSCSPVFRSARTGTRTLAMQGTQS